MHLLAISVLTLTRSTQSQHEVTTGSIMKACTLNFKIRMRKLAQVGAEYRGIGFLCMQGNCERAPPEELVNDISGTELLPLKPKQCLLIAGESLMNVEQGDLWLDGLYVRQRSAETIYSSLISVGGQGSLWMTSVTLQGDGDGVANCQQCALDVTSQLYAEGASSTCLQILHRGELKRVVLHSFLLNQFAILAI
jgi:hypothetical protein